MLTEGPSLKTWTPEMVPPCSNLHPIDPQYILGFATLTE